MYRVEQTAQYKNQKMDNRDKEMHKNILAAAILAVVSAPSFATVTVYEEDGYKFDVKGDLEVNYKRSVGGAESMINIDDADFAFLAESQVNENNKIFGGIEFDGDATVDKETEEDNKTVKDVGEEKGVFLDSLYIGLKTGDVTVTAGRLYNFVDTIGAGTDYEVGGIYEAWTTTKLTDQTDQTIQVEWAANGYHAGVDIAQNKDGVDGTDDFQQISARVGAKFGIADVDAHYATESKSDSDMFSVQTVFDFNPVTVQAIYGHAEMGEVESDTFGVSAKYVAGQWDYSVGLSTLDEADKETMHKYYVNTGYAVSKNAHLFAELADEKDSSSLGFAVGARLSF